MAAPTKEETLLKRPLYIYDLPPELLSTLEPKTFDTGLQLEETPADTKPEEDDSSPSPHQDGPARATSCALCTLTFPTVADQRSHVRSDLHSYNLKQKLRGRKAVSEAEFEKLMGDLDESLSGSESEDSSASDTDTKSKPNMLSALLKKNATISDEPEVDTFTTSKRKRGSGRAPLVSFSSPVLPPNTTLSVWRAIFKSEEQAAIAADPASSIAFLQAKQLAPAAKPAPPKPKRDASDDEAGGVPLPQPKDVGPHMFLCMIGGGHFAAMVVSLSPKRTKKNGIQDERQASVIAHKTFHRYTTRRKQGGSQAANDNAKGAAHSAGSSLRRYNEEALVKEVRDLLSEWKHLIATSELLFIRATGTTNRRTLFGPYDGQVLTQNDDRNRGFPFSTRRATQAELMRCFVELTRVKVNIIDEEATRAAQQKAADEAAATAARQNAKAAAASAAKDSKPRISQEEEEALLHTNQIEALIRRSKAPALLSYLASNNLSPDFELRPLDAPARYHAPRALHLASATGAAAVVSALLTKGGADPTLVNGEGKTAFEVAGDRATRDVFRLARGEAEAAFGSSHSFISSNSISSNSSNAGVSAGSAGISSGNSESKKGNKIWDWNAARVPDPLSKSEFESRALREKTEKEAEETERRKGELDRLAREEKKREEEKGLAQVARTEKKHGKGQMLKTAQEKREEETRGMTPEMRMRLERERRARAMEARMRG